MEVKVPAEPSLQVSNASGEIIATTYDPGKVDVSHGKKFSYQNLDIMENKICFTRRR